MTILVLNSGLVGNTRWVEEPNDHLCFQTLVGWVTQAGWRNLILVLNTRGVVELTKTMLVFI